MSKPQITTEYLWCNTCKKAFPLYFIEFSETRWAMINPHACMHAELFKLCEDISKLKDVLKVLYDLEEIALLEVEETT